MARRRPKGEDQATQHLRFLETARALGYDEDEAAFKAKLAVIAQHKSKDEAMSGDPAQAPKRR